MKPKAEQQLQAIGKKLHDFSTMSPQTQPPGAKTTYPKAYKSQKIQKATRCRTKADTKLLG